MKPKNKTILFITILLFSIIFTISSITVSHGLDSYCTMCNGYKNTAIWFLQNGRIFSYLFYMLFNVIKLPYDSIRVVSVILSNVILTTTIIIMYNQIKNNNHNKLHKILLIGSIFLIYYTPLTPSILILDEAFIINLGILFLTVSSIYILKKSTKNYLISLLFAILGISCYQGLSAYLFISLFILILSKEEYRNNIKFYIKKTILIISIYGLSFLFNLLIIKIVGMITKKDISKIGELSIIDNLNQIINEFIPKVFKYFYGYINYKYYFIIILLSILIAIIYTIKNKNKLNNILLLLLLILSCAFSSFIPNLFMNSSSNYIESRMTLTVTIVPIIIIIYIIISFKVNKPIFYLLSTITIFILLVSFKSTYQNMNVDKKRFQTDIEYINNIEKYIKKYEETSGIYIDTIYYARDEFVAYYYHFGKPTDTNIRIMAIDWALDCAISSKLNREIDFYKISDEKYNELFIGKEYNHFSEEQLIFDDNILYLLVY